MVDRIRVRCSVCRSAVPITVLWAVGGICPRCSQPLRSANRSFNRDDVLDSPDDVLGKPLGVLHAEPSASPAPGGEGRVFWGEYVVLLDDIEHIPLAARESSMLSAEERAVVMARVVEFVRDRVLPQSDREEEGLEALSYTGVAAVAGDERTSRRTRDHDAIVERIDELARVDPRNGVRVQELLYRLYAAIADHFGEAERMVAWASDEGPTSARSATRTGAGDVTPSRWFG